MQFLTLSETISFSVVNFTNPFQPLPTNHLVTFWNCHFWLSKQFPMDKIKYLHFVFSLNILFHWEMHQISEVNWVTISFMLTSCMYSVCSRFPFQNVWNLSTLIGRVLYIFYLKKTVNSCYVTSTTLILINSCTFKKGSLIIA